MRNERVRKYQKRIKATTLTKIKQYTTFMLHNNLQQFSLATYKVPNPVFPIFQCQVKQTGFLPAFVLTRCHETHKSVQAE